ncbi:hypothetical protein K523DRAFT_360231 [Schizophyllum commune Tattone D]|nr:hypothetical protein K523DRAFT_360231 [Schizophyllum commune Tattone D]
MATADAASELLIARLLEQDLENLRSAREAERLQLDLATAATQLAAGRIPKNTYPRNAPSPSDSEIALELYLAEQTASADAAYAESLHATQEAAAAGDFQYAQKVAAAERKAALDAAFARRLQADDSEDINMNVDAEGMLSRDEIERIMSEDPNDKGKGRANGKAPEVKMEMKAIVDIPNGAPICGICLDVFQLTHSPIKAAASANSSSKLPFGLRLPCPSGHSYCIDCLSSHIKSKLDPSGDGTGAGPSAIVFPIRCPECSPEEWPTGITDDVAQRVLSEKGMVMWHTQRLLDSLPKLYCPNKQCSALVQAHEDADEPRAECPSCMQAMCVPCRVAWHQDLSCEEFQALPPDERDPEDRALLELARAQSWRRCPECMVIVELTVGCNHMICRCGTHFCFRCGSLWKKGRGREPGQCTRDPPCDLWDENMLLDEMERHRQARAGGNANRPQPAQPQRVIQPRPVVQPQQDAWNDDWEEVIDTRDPFDALDLPGRPWQAAAMVPGVFGGGQLQHRTPTPPPGYRSGSLEWMTEDPQLLCTRHWFTTNMVRDLRCGYCDAMLNSLADLRYHLEHVNRHPVYACCGRFFRRNEDFERHLDATPARFGRHVNQFQNQ